MGAQMLNAHELCQMDTTCSTLHATNCCRIGPWRTLGSQVFQGLEVQQEGLFTVPDSLHCTEIGKKVGNVDWKARFGKFLQPSLCVGSVWSSIITYVPSPDEVAYWNLAIRTDVLHEQHEHGIYLEVEVLSNADNLSIAVVDFESAGNSSLTFSPDVGAVIREEKVCESPRRVKGSYVQPLKSIPNKERFLGNAGMYIRSGCLAFFRRTSNDADTLSNWETTGFVSDVSWAGGHYLTPTLAFRNAGEYSVRVLHVATQPPISIDRPNEASLRMLEWRQFD